MRSGDAAFEADALGLRDVATAGGLGLAAAPAASWPRECVPSEPFGGPDGDLVASCAARGDAPLGAPGRAISRLGMSAGKPARPSSTKGAVVDRAAGVPAEGAGSAAAALTGPVAPPRAGGCGTNAALGPSRSGGSTGWFAAPLPSATNVLSSSSSPSSGSLGRGAAVAVAAAVAATAAVAVAVAVAEDLIPTGPLSVIGIGTFAARGISGIASGGILPEKAGGCVITVRRVASLGPPAAGTTIGTFGPFGRAGWLPALGDVRPISVRTGPLAAEAEAPPPAFAPALESPFPAAAEAGTPAAGRGELSSTLARTFVTDESSSTGFDAPAPAAAPFAKLPTSSGIVAAGTHSGMPGRHTSVDRGRTLVASAERSSSVRTSR